MRTINVCPGIGDNIWLFQKLVHSGERFDFQMTSNHPQRGKQIFDLFPQVSASCTYIDTMQSYKFIKNYAERGTFASIKKDSFFLECNTHLEQGRRIEKYMPDLDTSFRLEYATTEADKITAMEIMNGFGKEGMYGASGFAEHGLRIGIYGSSYSSARRWNFWQEKEWFELCLFIKAKYPTTVFVLFGADWDVDLATKLIEKFNLVDIPYINTVGQPLSVVIELLKWQDYFFGFPSGLSILNETIGKDGMMFYPAHLKNMMTKWCDPDRVGIHFKECEFCTPQTAFNWWKQNFKYL